MGENGFEGIKSITELKSLVRPKVLLYGRSGSGKTQSAAMSSQDGGADTLFIVTEPQGLATIRRICPHAPNIAMVYTYDDFNALVGHINALLAGGGIPWGCVVLDTLDDFQRVLRNKVCAGKTKATVTQNDWGVIIDQTESVVRYLRNLPCSLILIAHTAERTDQDGQMANVPAFVGKQTYDRVSRNCNLVLMQRKFTQENGDVRYGIETEGGESNMTKTQPGLPRVVWPDDPIWRRIMHVQPKEEEPKEEEDTGQPQPQDAEKA